MPYESEAQRDKFHELLKQGKIDPATVAEFDKASKGLHLPRHKNPGRPGHTADAAKRRAFFNGR